MVLTRYSQVLRHPHVARLLVTAVIARLPQGMSGFAIILFLTPHLGYARAGVATGVSVAGAGVSNVLLARAVDRVGARRVLAPAAALYAVAMVTLAESGHDRYAVQLVICGVVGIVTPPISSVSRGLWPRLLGEAEAQVVYGLEATAQELIFIAGPAAVAVVAGLSSARIALIVSGVIGVVGAVAYVTAPPFATAPDDSGDRARQRVLRGTGVLRYALVGVCMTLGFNMTDISTVAFVGGQSASASAGVVLAVWSAGSLAGGLVFGAAKRNVTDTTLSRVVSIAAVGLSAAALAPNPVGLAAILFLSGAAVAPTLARLYTRMGAAAGEGTRTEAFGWLAVGFLIGSSAGSALGGVLVDAIGPRWTFLLAGVAALCAVPIISLRRPVPSRHAG
jgi:predicted MFS family arabinose efflux permease